MVFGLGVDELDRSCCGVEVEEREEEEEGAAGGNISKFQPPATLSLIGQEPSRFRTQGRRESERRTSKPIIGDEWK